MAGSNAIVPVILSGGAGTRLWPLSRRLRPKQFLALGSENSMFRETIARVSGAPFGPAMAVCSAEHRFLVAEEFRRAETPFAAILLEPCPRNTAPAIAAAAAVLERQQAGALMLVLPSDHVIGDQAAFEAAVASAATVAADGQLVTFGIVPTEAETGYGYIQTGEPFVGQDNVHSVAAFVEKPDIQTARNYLADGGYLWNSGMFMFTPESFLGELARHHPKMVETCREAVAAGQADLDFLRLDEPAFAAAEAISVDYAVMEKTDRAAVVRFDAPWSDLGSWSALWALDDADADGNVITGDAIAIDSHDVYIRSEKPLVAAIGVENLIIVATDDAVLVVPRDRAQDVRLAVAELAARGREESESHSRVYRPWGYYQNLDGGDGFLVKQIVVNPGARLSLQYHHRRAEHWVVVEGRARVTNGEQILDLEANQSTYIPLGARHRLENPGDTPLRLIEVQSGDYIGEDDIVRLEDNYGRD